MGSSVHDWILNEGESDRTVNVVSDGTRVSYGEIGAGLVVGIQFRICVLYAM